MEEAGDIRQAATASPRRWQADMQCGAVRQVAASSDGSRQAVRQCGWQQRRQAV
jgi:hypothetical protein